MHSSSNSLYIPDPSEGKVLIIDTDNDKIKGEVGGTGDCCVAQICRDRDIVFLTGSSLGEALTYRIGGQSNLLALKFDFPPTGLSLDSDRDVLLASGNGFAFYRYPELKELDFQRPEGKVRQAHFDSLEDAFVILFREPSRLLKIKFLQLRISVKGKSIARSKEIDEKIVSTNAVEGMEPFDPKEPPWVVSGTFRAPSLVNPEWTCNGPSS